jgi:hypothetical protein
VTYGCFQWLRQNKGSFVANRAQTTGNPVFDFKAGFRTTAQSIQRVLFLIGTIELVAGFAARLIAVENEDVKLALRYAPLLGLASLLASGVWGFVWRSKLRSDFQAAFGSAETPRVKASDA